MKISDMIIQANLRQGAYKGPRIQFDSAGGRPTRARVVVPHPLGTEWPPTKKMSDSEADRWAQKQGWPKGWQLHVTVQGRLRNDTRVMTVVLEGPTPPTETAKRPAYESKFKQDFAALTKIKEKLWNNAKQ